jgi:hypothetical protein
VKFNTCSVRRSRTSMQVAYVSDIACGASNAPITWDECHGLFLYLVNKSGLRSFN